MDSRTFLQHATGLLAYLEDQGLLAPWQRWSPVSQLMARCVLLQDATWLSIHHTRLHYRGMPDADPQLMLVPAICIPQSFSHSNETRFVPFLGAFDEHGPHSNRAIFENAGKLIARCNQGSPLPFADQPPVHWEPEDANVLSVIRQRMGDVDPLYAAARAWLDQVELDQATPVQHAARTTPRL